MIFKRNGKFVLMNSTGEKILGTHTSFQDAIKQEYAIGKSQKKSKEEIQALINAEVKRNYKKASKYSKFIKRASLRSQLSMLKRFFGQHGEEIATHATSGENLAKILKTRKINTPLRMVKTNPNLLTEHPLKNYAKLPPDPTFMNNLQKYESLQPHLRGELRKGYFNYLDNIKRTDSPIANQLKETFGDNLGSVASDTMAYEAALGKSEKWLKKKRFKEVSRRFKDRLPSIYNEAKGEDPRLASRAKRMLGSFNTDRNAYTDTVSMRGVSQPMDMVSFSNKVHNNTRFGNNTIIAPKKNLHLGGEGPMDNNGNIYEYEHLGPYRVRPSDLILTEGAGNQALKGLGHRTISPKAISIFNKIRVRNGLPPI